MDRLSEIRARCEAATPGPWWWSLSDLMVVIWGGAQDENAATGKQIVVDGDGDFDCCPENAEFITNAREDIPYLLEQLNIAIARAEKAEKERDAAVEDITHGCDTCTRGQDCEAGTEPECARCYGNVDSWNTCEDCWQWRGVKGE